MKAMNVQKFAIGSLGENIYVAYDETSKEALVVDPGRNIETVINYIKQNDLKLKYILITHAHIDHIEGVEPLWRMLGGKILLHSEDMPALTDEETSLAYMLTEPYDKFEEYSDIEKEPDFKIGNSEIKIIHTPGHTMGSVCILIDNLLFSGDTLFIESIGRTDFPGGNFSQIIKSIKENLLVLPPDTVVYSGHGDETTIGHEAKYNTFLNGNMHEL
jgi:hydroxyacylglutathione hydrolase